MRVSIDVDSGTALGWTGQAIAAISWKRGDLIPVEVRYEKSGEALEMPSAASGVIGVKASGSLSGNFLAYSNSWEKSGSGPTASYTFLLDLNTEEMEALFTSEPATVAAVMEIETTMPGVLLSTNTITLTVNNSVIRGDEGYPIHTGSNNGKTPIANGYDYVDVVFDGAYPTANWHFVGAPVISNLIDATPLGIMVVGLTSRSEAGFTIKLSTAVDTSNYKLEWVATLD